MENKFSLNNFGKQNTPKLVQKIGDVLLLAGTIGLGIVGLPATMAVAGAEAGIALNIALPTGVMVAGKGLVAAGVIGKLFTKFFGTKEENMEEPK
jgi:hypothetical protein